MLAVATLFAGHHQEHADAFGAVAGDDARPEANAKLVEAVTPTLEAVGAAEPSDELTGQILAFARDLENQAAYTYAAALTLLSDPAFAAATSTILPIEAQHATVLTLALGGRTRRAVPHRRLRVDRPRRRHRPDQGPRPGRLRLTHATRHERNDTRHERPSGSQP